MDDFAFISRMKKTSVINDLVKTGFWDLYIFSGTLQENKELLLRGYQITPWWSHPQVKMRYMRPISSLSHRIDSYIFPLEESGENSLACYGWHLHSIIWYLILIWIIGSAYLSLLTPIVFSSYTKSVQKFLDWKTISVASLATLLYDILFSYSIKTI